MNAPPVVVARSITHRASEGHAWAVALLALDCWSLSTGVNWSRLLPFEPEQSSAGVSLVVIWCRVGEKSTRLPSQPGPTSQRPTSPHIALCLYSAVPRCRIISVKNGGNANHQDAKYPVADPVPASGILSAEFVAQWHHLQSRHCAGTEADSIVAAGCTGCLDPINELPSPSSRAEDGRAPRERDKGEHGAKTTGGTET